MKQINQLSRREWEVVRLLMQGKSNKLIAASLAISERTVEFHLKNIYTKFQVSSRIELILKLVNATGGVDLEKLGYSTVDNSGKTTENGDRFDSQKNWIVSPWSERNGTMNTHIRKILQNALTGFAPSVFLLMIITEALDGIRYFTKHHEWQAFLKASIMEKTFWEVFLLELFLLTGGYVATTLIFGFKGPSLTLRRSVLAGIGAVIGLALLSVFIQPASLPMIALVSLLTGGLSVLLPFHKSSQTMNG